jgi:quinohemoprotein ethanol dehydrogenase
MIWRSTTDTGRGWGGVYGESARATDKEAPGTVFTFAIGGKAPLPKFKTYQSAGLLEA